MAKEEDIKKDLPKKKENHQDNKKIKNEKKDKHLKEIAKLKEENQSLNDKVLRITAEMQNMRRRYEDEIARIRKFDGVELIEKVLSVVDNFERAINLDDDNLEDELSKFLSGFKLIYADLIKILEEKNVSVIDCLNKEFDPTMMEAVLTENNKDIGDNIVVDVLQKGYTYNDKVIRPAMVKVNKLD